MHGEPIRFGVDGHKGLIRDSSTGGIKIAEVAEVGEDAVLVHDAHNPDPSTAFAISRLTDAGHLHRAPVGIFRQVERPVYDDQVRAQVRDAEAAAGDTRSERLTRLIGGGDTWTVV